MRRWHNEIIQDEMGTQHRTSARDLGHTGNDQVHLLSSQELRLPPETIKRAQAMSISLVFIFEEDHGHL